MLYTEAAEEAAMARIRLEEVRGALTQRGWGYAERR